METRACNLTIQEAEAGGPLMSLRSVFLNKTLSQGGEISLTWAPQILNLWVERKESMGLGRKNYSLIFIRFWDFLTRCMMTSALFFNGCFVCWFGCSFLETVSRRPGWPKIFDLPGAGITSILHQTQLYTGLFASCFFFFFDVGSQA